MDGRNSPPTQPDTRSRWPIVVAAVVVIAMAIGGLVTGATWLTWPTPLWTSLPLGNGVIWLALIGLALLSILATAPGTWLRRLSLMALLLALSWLPVGYWLSGNWGFNFDGGQGYLVWQRLTAVIVLLPLSGLLLAGIMRGVKRRAR